MGFEIVGLVVFDVCCSYVRDCSEIVLVVVFFFNESFFDGVFQVVVRDGNIEQESECGDQIDLVDGLDFGCGGRLDKVRVVLFKSWVFGVYLQCSFDFIIVFIIVIFFVVYVMIIYDDEKSIVINGVNQFFDEVIYLLQFGSYSRVVWIVMVFGVIYI